MIVQLLIPAEIDRRLRLPAGKAERLARRGKLPHIVLPGGEIRFDEAEIEQLLTPQPKEVTPCATAK